VEEFVCLTVRSRAGEAAADFAARLSRFWTHMLRNRQSDFENVYAETTAFEQDAGRLTRQYLVRECAVDVVVEELAAAGVDHAPVDRDDAYSKYEATPPHWMQIEH
jgi:hypothetical protein